MPRDSATNAAAEINATAPVLDPLAEDEDVESIQALLQVSLQWCLGERVETNPVYVFLQRYRHRSKRWLRRAYQQQEGNSVSLLGNLSEREWDCLLWMEFFLSRYPVVGGKQALAHAWSVDVHTIGRKRAMLGLGDESKEEVFAKVLMHRVGKTPVTNVCLESFLILRDSFPRLCGSLLTANKLEQAFEQLRQVDLKETAGQFGNNSASDFPLHNYDKARFAKKDIFEFLETSTKNSVNVGIWGLGDGEDSRCF